MLHLIICSSLSNKHSTERKSDIFVDSILSPRLSLQIKHLTYARKHSRPHSDWLTTGDPSDALTCNWLISFQEKNCSEYLNLSMPILGDGNRRFNHSHVNGDIVAYSFRLPNNPNKLADNDRSSQRNDTVTKRHFIKLYEGDCRDMNLTLVSTLRATGATTATATSEDYSVSAEHYMEVKLSQDIGNVTLAVSKVKCHVSTFDLWITFDDLYSRSSTASLRKHSQIQLDRRKMTKKLINFTFMRWAILRDKTNVGDFPFILRRALFTCFSRAVNLLQQKKSKLISVKAFVQNQMKADWKQSGPRRFCVDREFFPAKYFPIVFHLAFSRFGSPVVLFERSK